MNNRTNDPYNLRTLGKIKDLSVYPSTYKNKMLQKRSSGLFSDDLYPFIDFVVSTDTCDYYYNEIKELYGYFSKDWSEFKLYDDTQFSCYNRGYRDNPPYFHPEYPYKERFETLHSYGVSKSVADVLSRKQVLDCADTVRKFNNGDRYFCFVKVEAYIDGVSVGYASLGGVDNDDTLYHNEVISELKHEILNNIPDMVTAEFEKIAHVKEIVDLHLA